MIAPRSLVLYGTLGATVAASIWLGSVDESDESAPNKSQPVALASAPAVGIQADAAPSPVSAAVPTARAETSHTYRLPERPAAGGTRDGADAFGAYSWTPPPAAPVLAERGPPVAPALPFTYSGQLQTEGTTRYLLAEGLATHIVLVGEDVGEFRLETADEAQLVFRHAATGGHQTLSIAK